MLQKQLKKFFKLIKKDLFQNKYTWLNVLRTLRCFIVVCALVLIIIFTLAGIGYIITVLWKSPYMQLRTSGSGQNVCDSYVDIGLAFVIIIEIVGFLVYNLFKFFRWLLQKWKEAEKED